MDAEGPQKQLSEATISLFRDAFKAFDTKQAGYISLQEIGELLGKLNCNVNPEEMKDMINEVDIEGTGNIDFKEFIQLISRKMRDIDNEDEYIEGFKLFDKDNDDLISIDDMREIMSILGEYVWGEVPQDEDIVQMIKEADTDFDGYLHYSDFIKKIKNN